MDTFTFDDVQGLRYGEQKVVNFDLKVKEVNKTVHLPTGEEHTEYLIKAESGEKRQVFQINTLNPASWFSYSTICTDAAISQKQRKLLHLYLQSQVQNIEVEEVIELDRMGLFTYDGTAIFCTGEEVFMEGTIPRTIKINPNIARLAKTYRKDMQRKELMNGLMQILNLQKGISDVLFGQKEGRVMVGTVCGWNVDVGP